MSIQIISVDQQADGNFDNGRILEKKPIGFPQEGGLLSSYSCLFYWAHAWSDEGGLIAEHPHQGFEIMSWVIEGSIEHYDNKAQGWKSLNKGDLQIIRAGNGITHAEKINAKSSIFQIWFDPGLEYTLSEPASYNDYQNDLFPVVNESGMNCQTLIGEGSPVELRSEVKIRLYDLKKGEKNLELQKDKIYSFFVLKGSLRINNETITKNQFVKVQDSLQLNLNIAEQLELFMIEIPQKVEYRLYSE